MKRMTNRRRSPQRNAELIAFFARVFRRTEAQEIAALLATDD
jgi:hypothetical protein